MEDWISNARQEMSRREFIAGVGATGVSLAGFAVAATPVAGQIITTPTDGLVAADSKVPAGDFQVPIYEARPSAAGRYPVVLVIPEVWGMHEHIKDVARRFAREGFLGITFEPYAREGGVLHLPDQASLQRVVNAVPDARVMGDLDALVAYAKQHAFAHPDRIGVTGFCRGGTYTLLLPPTAGRSRLPSPGTARSSRPGLPASGPSDRWTWRCKSRHPSWVSTARPIRGSPWRT